MQLHNLHLKVLLDLATQLQQEVIDLNQHLQTVLEENRILKAERTAAPTSAPPAPDATNGHQAPMATHGSK